MTGTYPVKSYLQRIGVAKTPICPHCDERVLESLTLFVCLCPKFRKAPTSAHNQVRDVITSFLTFTLRSEWTLFEETRVANTGLVHCSPSRTDNDINRLGRRQPDWILVSKKHKRIAIVDLCRPSDVHQTQLPAAAIRKQQAHQPLRPHFLIMSKTTRQSTKISRWIRLLYRWRTSHNSWSKQAASARVEARGPPTLAKKDMIG